VPIYSLHHLVVSSFSKGPITHLTADINDVTVAEICNMGSKLKEKHKRIVTIRNFATKNHRQAEMDYKQLGLIDKNT